MSAATTSTLQFQPTGQGTGLTLSGLNLRQPLSPAAVSAIKGRLAEDGVLVLRGQTALSEDEQLAFTRAFGKTQGHPLPGLGGLNPEDSASDQVFYLTNAVEGHNPHGADARERQRNSRREDPGGKGHPISPGNGELSWHSDLQYMPEPQVYSVLYGIEIPTVGGQTEWCNMAQAYDALDDALKARIAPLRAVHWLTRRIPPVTHPVVRVHPLSGRRALYVSPGLTRHIDGMDEDESAALLAQLHAHATSSRFCYVHAWEPGDVVMWDNRITMHRRRGFDLAARRIVRRTQTVGEAVVAA